MKVDVISSGYGSTRPEICQYSKLVRCLSVFESDLVLDPTQLSDGPDQRILV